MKLLKKQFPSPRVRLMAAYFSPRNCNYSRLEVKKEGKKFSKDGRTICNQAMENLNLLQQDRAS